MGQYFILHMGEGSLSHFQNMLQLWRDMEQGYPTDLVEHFFLSNFTQWAAFRSIQYHRVSWFAQDETLKNFLLWIGTML
jgi:hypothetical protein